LTSPEVQPSAEIPVVKVLYLFAGRRRHSDVGAFLKQAESNGKIKLILKEFDIERSPMHDLTDVSLWSEIFDTLNEGGWCVIVSPPCNTFSRARFQHILHPGPKPLRTRAWPKGFPWLSNANKELVAEANFFVEKCLEACECAAGSDGFFILEHPEDLGTVQGEQPGSIWQWQEVLDLIPKFSAICFAIHQCHFGALTPKPTRLLTNMAVSDARCFCTLPKFDKLGFYKGPLPRKCGHRHKHRLIGKTGSKWNTSPSAAYPAGMCEFIAHMILNAFASYGGGGENQKSTPDQHADRLSCKRPLQTPSANTTGKRQRVGESPTGSASTSTSIAANEKFSVLQRCLGESPSGSAGSSANPPLKGDNSVTLAVGHLGESPAGSTTVEDASTDAITAGKNVAEQPNIDSLVESSEDSFDVHSCCNSGMPIQVEWDQVNRGFIDGFGLCSPTRWRPSQRGERRTPEMLDLANATFNILSECVDACISDVRKESFRLVTGKIEKSPFGGEALAALRSKFAALLPDPPDALVIDDGQPFMLRALSQWLKKFNDPDAKWLVDEEESFSTGVCLGVDKPLPRSPQVFPEKTKHRKLDESEFSPVADNYPSAQLSSGELEKKFREEEQLGRMFPSKIGVLKQEFKDRLRIASMAAISKPDGSVRPLHDGTHSVKVNHEIRYQDKILCPGPPEIAAMVREASESGEACFCVSADIKAAHRLVKIRRSDWGYMCCRADSSSDVVWVNQVGTFGISSAPYWWAKLAALIGRFVGYLFHNRWLMQMIYVDDLHGTFVGQGKFKALWIWVLAYELVGTPFGYHKFKGGFSSEFVGFCMRYDIAEVGISSKRGDWLVAWISKLAEQKFVVASRDFVEFLGRLSFVAQLLTWLKPHLAPLFAWSSVIARSTVGRLPETIIVTLRYILLELRAETFMVSTRRPIKHVGDQFRTDAKCSDGLVILAGWELKTRRWFSLRVYPGDAPYLFKRSGESQWASTSAELMATMLALAAFDWLRESKHRKSLQVAFHAGTDNRANEALTLKRATAKWPLMALNMQMSSMLSKARFGLNLQWRPREENTEADDLTNERFDDFDPKLRVEVSLQSMDLSILQALVLVHDEFEVAKQSAKVERERDPASKSKKFDKSPW